MTGDGREERLEYMGVGHVCLSEGWREKSEAQESVLNTFHQVKWRRY